jgi:hypothetical protein
VGHFAPADFNHDGHVTEADLDLLLSCFTGPEVPLGALPNCTDKDLDGDNDVDNTDFGKLQKCYTGPAVPADLNCLNAP